VKSILTKSTEMAHSPSWEASTASGSQEINTFYKTLSFIIIVTQPIVCILSQINPAHALPSYLF